MRQLLFYATLLVVFTFSFIFGKEYYSRDYLIQENTSSEKVAEIREMANYQYNRENSPAYFNNQSVAYIPDYSNYLANLPPEDFPDVQAVLGENDEKWIEVILSQQRLNAWEGNRLVYTYIVSTGKWAPTPVGTYRIWTKLRSTTMKGGSKALGTYYYLPNVPCTMYFYKGYGIHGTYWHNNFGHPMSHGCVNMRTPEACQVFEWANVGTRVTVHK